jgi:hydrogenase nickel incorporation protein HypA/HybF
MHEVSIVQSLLERVEQEARACGAHKVHAIEVSIGELAGVEVDLLRSAYSLFSETGPYRDTELRIERVAARWACPICQRPAEPGKALRCCECNRPMRLECGDEILLQRLEMEVE